MTAATSGAGEVNTARGSSGGLVVVDYQDAHGRTLMDCRRGNTRCTKLKQDKAFLMGLTQGVLGTIGFAFDLMGDSFRF